MGFVDIVFRWTANPYIQFSLKIVCSWIANHEQTTSPLFATCQVVKSFIGEAAYVRKVVGAATIGARGCESLFLPVTKVMFLFLQDASRATRTRELTGYQRLKHTTGNLVN